MYFFCVAGVVRVDGSVECFLKKVYPKFRLSRNHVCRMNNALKHVGFIVKRKKQTQIHFSHERARGRREHSGPPHRTIAVKYSGLWLIQ